MSVKKVTLAGLFTAVGVLCSAFYIPIGVAKAFPVQSFLNVLSAVILGPWYGLAMAFATSLLRNLLGTGSLLAFPGSMCGVLISAFLYKYTKKLAFAAFGEIIGTGIFGAFLAYPLAVAFLGSKGAAYIFVIPFAISAAVGSICSFFLLIALDKSHVLQKMVLGEEL